MRKCKGGIKLNLQVISYDEVQWTELFKNMVLK